MNLCAPTSASSVQASAFSRALNCAPAQQPHDSALQSMLLRFRAQFQTLANANGAARDVAVVFLAPGHAHRCAQNAAVQAQFRQARGSRLFEPFDTLTRHSGAEAVCYILRPSVHEKAGDFEAFYCASGSPTCATQHFRIEFESLLRALFANDYRYVMKEANLQD